MIRIVPIAIALVAALTFLAAPGISIYQAYFTDEVVTTTITEKITKRGTDSDKYLVFTDSEVFENVDSILRLKFNSSDVYGDIKEGANCVLLVNGWRIQFFSMYRNILEANCG